MMLYSDMIQALTSINSASNLCLNSLPHCSNLLFQLNKRKTDKEAWFSDLISLYLEIRNVQYNNLEEYVSEITTKTNLYMNFMWPPERNLFSHQADFTSSIIPEMLCLIFDSIIKCERQELEVYAQKDLTIECIFDAHDGGIMQFKNKRVDVAVVKTCQLSFNGADVAFPVPLLAIECKTNLDKNMISGIEHSVEELKKTFPDCKYFVITEVSDFDARKSNYASSGIDEIYVLRKQKRAVIRRTPNLRQNLSGALVFEIANTFREMAHNLNSEILSLNTRMANGKLIGREL